MLKDLYDRRTYLIESEGKCPCSDEEILSIEEEIFKLEYLPSFDEVIDMISTGRMKSIFA